MSNTTAAPNVHHRALITWLAVYPMITLTLGVLSPYIGHYPLYVRTLLLTAVVVPVVSYLGIPALLRAHGALFNR
ncbi:antibiotic biosynthesis monooxygenase (ABM) superfamily enzyme [Kitasatospora sp. MAP12-15]|uniref:hypothetical protein n=1 Tax=unclassified Kitasatospora TaxID=2633591 RepID=UPI00247543D1|nr:hypothetical protein [Kitasatospora sp. MAP12-44]MDH6112280.1 antibiotic biosynthesis monooxygenase (ABM) superfamily enzyme [Kitasatospora sp. MAP12-44]